MFEQRPLARSECENDADHDGQTDGFLPPGCAVQQSEDRCRYMNVNQEETVISRGRGWPRGRSARGRLTFRAKPSRKSVSGSRGYLSAGSCCVHRLKGTTRFLQASAPRHACSTLPGATGQGGATEVGVNCCALAGLEAPYSLCTSLLPYRMWRVLSLPHWRRQETPHCMDPTQS